MIVFKFKVMVMVYRSSIMGVGHESRNQSCEAQGRCWPHIQNTRNQYQWLPAPPWAAATFLAIYWGFACSPLEPSIPSSSALSFLQLGFLLGYEQLEAAYWSGTDGFLIILRCSRASAVDTTPPLLYRKTEPTTFPGLAATPEVSEPQWQASAKKQRKQGSPDTFISKYIKKEGWAISCVKDGDISGLSYI